ncbi:Uncharacterized protein FWK35_00021368 [Aphis craccivora]|uniref:Uncharacterized protein n=1 Tax=Aphis craccivora TaxID=307492 RepID=A0A6G0Y827_APHCR|nr:Uncharacterized protein FWK35_00021368 [Aphis craccivora]
MGHDHIPQTPTDLLPQSNIQSSPQNLSPTLSTHTLLVQHGTLKKLSSRNRLSLFAYICIKNQDIINVKQMCICATQKTIAAATILI